MIWKDFQAHNNKSTSEQCQLFNEIGQNCILKHKKYQFTWDFCENMCNLRKEISKLLSIILLKQKYSQPIYFKSVQKLGVAGHYSVQIIDIWHYPKFYMWFCFDPGTEFTEELFAISGFGE